MATFGEMFSEVFRGRIFKCDCRGDTPPFLVLGDLGYLGARVYSLGGDGEFRNYQLDCFQCHAGNINEISPRDLSANEAQVLCHYEALFREIVVPELFKLKS